MQISVESTSDLGRKVAIAVPVETIKERIEKRLAELSKTVKLDGFRPGKVPVRAVRDRFGKDVQKEVVDELMYSSFNDVVKQEKLNPVGMPSFEAKEYQKGYRTTAAIHNFD